jgi:hypothetical protein
MIGGAIRAPPALWAWIQGRSFWNGRDWKYCNLTEHTEEVSQEDYSIGGGVQDDSLHQFLGVAMTASSKEIKRVYYKLAI